MSTHRLRFIQGAHLDGRQDINPDVFLVTEHIVAHAGRAGHGSSRETEDVWSEAVRGARAPGGATPEPPASPGTSEEECDGDDSSWSSS